MTDKSPQAVVGGCLSRVFTLFGLFLFLSAVVAAVREFNGPGAGLEITGAFVPALILLAMGRLIKRRVDQVAEVPDAQIPRPQRPTPSPPPADVVVPRPAEERTPKARPEPVDIPELPTVEPTHHPGELPAVEDLGIRDFEPPKPMSSEERIRKAREKFNKKN